MEAPDGGVVSMIQFLEEAYKLGKDRESFLCGK
jgi:hypothetical protein